jgi:membrane-anchored protein YejM (alkaline phosphatase superfamily)
MGLRWRGGGAPRSGTALAVLAVLHALAGGALLWGYLGYADLAGLPWPVALAVKAVPVTLGLLLGLSVLLVGLVARPLLSGWGALGASAALAWGELWLLLLDRPLFHLTRLHLDGQTLQALRQPDALAQIGLPPTARAQALLLGAGALAAACALAAGAGWLSRSAHATAMRTWARRLALVATVVALAERGVSAAAAVGVYTERSDPATLFPLASWVTFQFPADAVEAVLGWKGAYGRDAAVDREAQPRPSTFRYPAPELDAWRPPEGAPRYNILLVGIESLRPEQVDPETMPHLAALARRSWWAEQHYSSSNCTHLGLFSLLSGLSPRAWGPMTDARRPPVPYALLERAGYRVTATSSVAPTWFGLDRHVLRRELALGGHWGFPNQDRGMVDEAKQFLVSRPEPFFAFFFFNGTHFPYEVPADGEVFRPSAGADVALSDPGLVERRTELLNRYRNALHRVDALLGELLARLRESGLEERTIIAVTGDHGESFWEDGRFSHTSLLSRAQLHVPLVLSIPGQAPRRLEQLTHHVDVMPTLLDAAGMSPPPSQYSDGVSLLREPGNPRALSMQYDREEPSEYALLSPPLLLRFRLRHGSVRWDGGEWLDGRRSTPEELQRAMESGTGAQLLPALRDANRWWSSSP